MPESTLTAPAALPIPGTYNFRDIAHYRRNDKTELAHGVYYRADNLGRLNEEGRDALVSLGVGVAIDLRTSAEINRYPNPLATDPRISYFAIDLVGNSHQIISRGDSIVSERLNERHPDGTFVDPVGRLVVVYSTILEHQHEAIRKVIDILAGHDRSRETAAVFHCVAGQDRTGLIAMLLLAIAGIDDSAIVFDYAATALYNVDRFNDENGSQWWQMELKTAAEYGAQFCPPDAMRGTLHFLYERYGGVMEYLRTIGIDEATVDLIQDRLLVGARKPGV